MKRILFLLVFSLFALLSINAQSPGKWSKDIMSVQFRSEVNFPAFSTPQVEYRTQMDITIGQLYNYHLNDRFTFSTGLALNYASYIMGDNRDELFIDFFKRTGVHHFAMEKAALFNLEIPLLLETKILQTKKNNRFSLITGLRQQFLLHSRFEGQRFGRERTVSASPFFPSKENSLDLALLNDWRVEAGFRLEKPMKKNSLLIDIGSQFSLVDKGFSTYFRIGWRF